MKEGKKVGQLLELTATVLVDARPYTFAMGIEAARMPVAWVDSMQVVLIEVTATATKDPVVAELPESVYAARAADTLARMTSNVVWVRVYSSPQLSVAEKIPV